MSDLFGKKRDAHSVFRRHGFRRTVDNRAPLSFRCLAWFLLAMNREEGIEYQLRRWRNNGSKKGFKRVIRS